MEPQFGLVSSWRAMNPETDAPSSPIVDQLQEIHGRYVGFREGRVATYIPELAKANPDWFGICLVTTSGHVYEVGDSSGWAGPNRAF